MKRHAEEIRRRSRRVGELPSSSLAFADEIKGALASGVAALRVLGAEGRDGWLSSWIEDAGRASDAIDVRSPAGLQQAAIQDAFRTVADALKAVAQLRGLAS